jgi:LPS sulfotransferase NodH
MHRVRETYGEGINPRSFQAELWQAHTSGLVARAETHTWTEEDFKKIRQHLQNLGDDSAALQWKRIEQFGQKGVDQALGLPPNA